MGFGIGGVNYQPFLIKLIGLPVAKKYNGPY